VQVPQEPRQRHQFDPPGVRACWQARDRGWHPKNGLVFLPSVWHAAGAIELTAPRMTLKKLVPAGWISLSVLSLLLFVGVPKGAGQSSALDPCFNPGTGPDDIVRQIAVQGDGKILVGGYFTNFNSVRSPGITRLLSNGTVDPSFQVGQGADSGVISLALQADGRVVIGGEFTQYDGRSAVRIARLTPDGKLDDSFKVTPGFSGESGPAVYALSVQADHKIVVGGQFSSAQGVAHVNVVRLNRDGGLDTNFQAQLPSDALGTVHAVTVQPDGKILIGGLFTNVNGLPFPLLARLEPNGTLDTSFKPNFGDSRASGVLAIALQPDRKVVAGVIFSTFFDDRYALLRFNADGTLDSSFNVNTDLHINSVTLQGNGGVVFGGYFTALDNAAIGGVARVKPDGAIDTSLNRQFRAANEEDLPGVLCLALQANGKLLIGGYFESVDGQPRRNFARLLADPTDPAGTRFFLTPLTRVTNNQVSLTLMGEANRSYRLEISSNLVNWTAWTNFTSQADSTDLVDFVGTNSPNRFYRAQSP
jgi:uncharacterized delta-60 repeat protein